MSGSSFHGDAKPREAWDILSKDSKAALVDVRTAAEWSFVGLPDLSRIGGEVIRLEWQTYPSMQVDADFVRKLGEALRSAQVEPDSPIFFLCRSGVRSAAAAQAMTAAGYGRCFNILGGFEGQRDAEGHRGNLDGWKAEGLPWVQN